MSQTHRSYLAFHASASQDPSALTPDWFQLLLRWTARSDDNFWFTNGKDKATTALDLKLRELLRAQMVSRMRKSRHLLVVLGSTPVLPTDWLCDEICYAVDECKLPVIAAYTAVSGPILQPSVDSEISQYWPLALRSRIVNQIAGVIHIPFMPGPLKAAVAHFSPHTFPSDGALGWYTEATYESWGMLTDHTVHMHQPFDR
jgi:hypothetical protein